MDEVAFQSETMSSLECPGGALCWLITPEEPDEARAMGEALVSGCFHGLPRHLDHMVCWREGRTATSFHLGHRPKTGGHLSHTSVLVGTQSSSSCLIWPLNGLRKPDLPPCALAVSLELSLTSLLPQTCAP